MNIDNWNWWIKNGCLLSKKHQVKSIIYQATIDCGFAGNQIKPTLPKQPSKNAVRVTRNYVSTVTIKIVQNSQNNFTKLKNAMEHKDYYGGCLKYAILLNTKHCLFYLNEKGKITTYKGDNLFEFSKQT